MPQWHDTMTPLHRYTTRAGVKWVKFWFIAQGILIQCFVIESMYYCISRLGQGCNSSFNLLPKTCCHQLMRAQFLMPSFRPSSLSKCTSKCNWIINFETCRLQAVAAPPHLCWLWAQELQGSVFSPILIWLHMATRCQVQLLISASWVILQRGGQGRNGRGAVTEISYLTPAKWRGWLWTMKLQRAGHDPFYREMWRSWVSHVIAWNGSCCCLRDIHSGHLSASLSEGYAQNHLGTQNHPAHNLFIRLPSARQYLSIQNQQVDE